MAEINLVLGIFTGMLVVSALVLVVVIILEPPGHRRTKTLQAQVGNTPRRKPFPAREKTSIFSRIMRAWGKGTDSEDHQPKEEPTNNEQFSTQVLAVDNQKSEVNEISPPMDDNEKRPNNKLVSDLKPNADARSSSEERVYKNGINITPESQTEEAASTKPVNNIERSTEMIDIPPSEEETNEELDSQSPRQERGDWTSAFTDIQVEESQASKLAKSLNNVDIHDLITRCKTLANSLRG